MGHDWGGNVTGGSRMGTGFSVGGGAPSGSSGCGTSAGKGGGTSGMGMGWFGGVMPTSFQSTNSAGARLVPDKGVTFAMLTIVTLCDE